MGGRKYPVECDPDTDLCTTLKLWECHVHTDIIISNKKYKDPFECDPGSNTRPTLKLWKHPIDRSSDTFRYNTENIPPTVTLVYNRLKLWKYWLLRTPKLWKCIFDCDTCVQEWNYEHILSRVGRGVRVGEYRRNEFSPIFLFGFTPYNAYTITSEDIKLTGLKTNNNKKN